MPTTAPPQLNQRQVIKSLTDEINKTPERINQMNSELTALIKTFEMQINGIYHTAVADNAQPGGYFQDQIAQRTRSIRNSPKFKQLFKLTTETLKNALTRKINTMQTRLYRESLRAITRVWNDATPKGLQFKSTISNGELETIHSGPVGGFTVDEWMEQFTRELNGTMTKTATRSISGEEGKTSGGVATMNKSISRAFKKLTHDVTTTAVHAMNIAIQAAFEQESELFSDKKNWSKE